MTAHTDTFGPFALRTLGTTGLRVTPLSVGCAPQGNMPETFTYEVTEEQALATIRAIFTGPINFLDTAASYGDGESERRLTATVALAQQPIPANLWTELETIFQS
jgi:D-threo-aldose 1-dehydrogenase